MTPRPDETDVASLLCRLELEQLSGVRFGIAEVPDEPTPMERVLYQRIEELHGDVTLRDWKIEGLERSLEIACMANATLRTKLAAAEGRAVPAVCQPCESAAVQWQRTRFNRLLWFTGLLLLAAAVGWGLWR
jgi:hypothetical protein